jgi:hypothetical protein
MIALRAENYKFPIVKRYTDDQDGRRRDKSIEIYYSKEWCFNSDDWIEGYRVAACHECWTGAEWLTITNQEFTPSFEHAVELAKEMQSALYE